MSELHASLSWMGRNLEQIVQLVSAGKLESGL